MKKVCEYIINKNNKNILIISTVIFLFFMIFVLPKISMISEELTGSSSSPDTSLIYNSEDLFKIAYEYGEEGRDAYIILRFTFDIAWPIVYFVFLTSITAFLLKRFESKDVYKCLVLLPFLGLVFDFLENITLAFVMYKYPVEILMAANVAPFFTLFKWIFIVISFCIILIIPIIHYFKRLIK